MKIAHPFIYIAMIASGLLGSSTPGHAQAAITTAAAGGESAPWNRGVPVERREEARALFLEGNRLFNVPLFSQAAQKYSEAISRWKHPAFYFNLAFAELNLGRDLEARDNLEQAVKYGEQPLGPERFHEAQNQLKDVEGHLGRIRVSCPTAGAEVTLDGAPLFTAPGSREVWVKAQPHEVTAKKPEYVPQARRVIVKIGALETLELRPSKLIEDRPWAVWKPWAVVGTGAAIAVAGGTLHAFSAKHFQDYDNAFLELSCASMGCKEAEIPAAMGARLDRARLEQKLAVTGYVAGGALLAAGAVLVYLNRPHLAEQGGASARMAGVSVVPIVSPDALGLLVTVSH